MSDLQDKWNNAAELIDDDPMRPIRYGMGIRYLNNFSKNIRILEVGVGEGTGLTYFFKTGYFNLHGLEVSPERIKRAYNKLPESVDIKCYGTEDLFPYQDGFFDVVVSFAVIEHTLDPAKFMSEINRVLKPNGYSIISSDCYTWRILQKFGLYISDQPVDIAMSPFKLMHMFKSRGFKVCHIDTFNYVNRGNVFIYYFKVLLSKILRKLFKIEFNANKNIITDNNFFENAKESYINYSRVFRVKKLIFNYLHDENIFLLKKIS